MKDLRKVAGELIRSHREAKGLSQEKLGFMVKLSQGQIRKYEAGDSAINIDMLPLIAGALDIPIERFFEKVKTRDLLKDLNNKIAKYKDILDSIENHPELAKVIREYNKNSENLKDVDLVKLLSKLASYPAEKKQTALNILMKGKI